MPRNKRIVGVHHLGETIQDGDNVLVKNDPTDNSAKGVFDVTKPFVASVISLCETHMKTVKLQVKWYYRPEDPLTGGRKAYHGQQELFTSDHEDTIDMSTVMGKCCVMDLSSYLNLSTHPGPDDFYTRFKFNPVHRLFQPSRVPVFCKCEQPYNPDRFMLDCCDCKSWYHPDCLPADAVPKCTQLAEFVRQRWRCPECCQKAAELHRQSEQEVQQLLHHTGQHALLDDCQPHRPHPWAQSEHASNALKDVQSRADRSEAKRHRQRHTTAGIPMGATTCWQQHLEQQHSMKRQTILCDDDAPLSKARSSSHTTPMQHASISKQPQLDSFISQGGSVREVAANHDRAVHQQQILSAVQ